MRVFVHPYLHVCLSVHVPVHECLCDYVLYVCARLWVHVCVPVCSRVLVPGSACACACTCECVWRGRWRLSTDGWERLSHTNPPQ